MQDPSGAFVANAEVRITNQDTSVLERSVRTGADGSFTAPLLPVGTYSVSVQGGGIFGGKVSRHRGARDGDYAHDRQADDAIGAAED